MLINGRSYIFLAATLMLLAGSLKFYADADTYNPNQLATFGTDISSCQSQAIRTKNVRLGCQSDLTTGVGSGTVVSRGSAKTIRVGN